MDKLKMHSVNKVDENVKKIGDLFPNTLTEVIKGYNEDGTPIIERAIDFDMLKQELSNVVVEGNEERYQFTWPDKKKSVLLANAPIAKTLRPCKEESVDFDTTENLYIEGDNLDVLKLLQETYLNKVKMIYIDPPYNTGNDFVYEDDYAIDAEEYLANSGQFDEEGNRLMQNTERNGRYHTDWLNMMYPRLKLAKDLLSEDGVIFISIDDNEVFNLKKICDEIFGVDNFVNHLAIKMSELSGVKMANVNRFPKLKESLLIYSKGDTKLEIPQILKSKENLEGYLKYYNNVITNINEKPEDWIIMNLNRYLESKEIVINNDADLYEWKLRNADKLIYRTNSRTIDKFIITNPNAPDVCSLINDVGKVVYKWGDKEMLFLENYLKEYIGDIWMDISTINLNKENMNLNFFKNGQKPLKLLTRLISLDQAPDSIILDFFSGSATTAHAVMQLNAEDGGNRKYIMVQLPEETDDKSEAYKAGYRNICEIGKERIRRAGEKIIEENKDKEGIENLDIGFRVLKVDSTNMKDVYYNPQDYSPDLFEDLIDNIKEDRTPEDLLFQVMLDLGILLSSKITESIIDDKKVFDVDDGYLIACFDNNVTDETIKAIAQQKPYYFVMRDSSMASDSVATNFDQIFETYSPETIRKVL